MSPTSPHVLSEPHSEVVFLLRKFSIVFSSATFDSDTVLASDEAFKKKLRASLRRHDFRSVRIWRVEWSLFLRYHLQTVNVQAGRRAVD